MAVHRKLPALLACEPDVAVVAECAAEDILRAKAGLLLGGASVAWVGSNAQKGLAIFGFGAYAVHLDERFDQRLRWIAPVRVEGPVSFNLLGVWALHRSVKETHPSEPRFAPVHQAVDVYADLLQERPTVVAGDFNHHVIWDKPGSPRNHAASVALLERAGLTSAYHRFHGCEQGAERHPTLYWRDRTVDGPAYHIDYCFVPESWASGL